ncbi:hypothetical protein HYE53_00895, partial [Aggregatibacter actinomycetemcomitans]|nr:hypothetical protein [Aggregatibacter actinomycetemcomitans]
MLKEKSKTSIQTKENTQTKTNPETPKVGDKTIESPKLPNVAYPLKP